MMALQSAWPRADFLSDPEACYIQDMRSARYFYSYYWFSNRIGGGETSA